MLIAAAKNEPLWLTVARGASVEIPDANIPPPGEATSALFVADCLRSAIGQGAQIPEPGDSIGELTMYGNPIDTQKQIPQIGSIVIINNPQAWIPANKLSPAAKLPNTAKAHVGFLVRSTMGMVYVLGEGVVRAFPKKSVASYRSPA